MPEITIPLCSVCSVTVRIMIVTTSCGQNAAHVFLTHESDSVADAHRVFFGKIAEVGAISDWIDTLNMRYHLYSSCSAGLAIRIAKEIHEAMK